MQHQMKSNKKLSLIEQIIEALIQVVTWPIKKLLEVAQYFSTRDKMTRKQYYISKNKNEPRKESKKKNKAPKTKKKEESIEDILSEFNLNIHTKGESQNLIESSNNMEIINVEDINSFPVLDIEKAEADYVMVNLVKGPEGEFGGITTFAIENINTNFTCNHVANVSMNTGWKRFNNWVSTTGDFSDKKMFFPKVESSKEAIWLTCDFQGNQRLFKIQVSKPIDRKTKNIQQTVAVIVKAKFPTDVVFSGSCIIVDKRVYIISNGFRNEEGVQIIAAIGLVKQVDIKAFRYGDSDGNL